MLPSWSVNFGNNIRHALTPCPTPTKACLITIMPSVFDSNTIPTDNRILRVNIYCSPIPLFAPILINIDRGSISPGYFHKIANAWLSVLKLDTDTRFLTNVSFLSSSFFQIQDFTSRKSGTRLANCLVQDRLSILLIRVGAIPLTRRHPTFSVHPNDRRLPN